ncbi:hypothetical protein, conserved [Entamoeba dispar SAW760]|uniref:PNPLA domain-containing protein n=1 Tax=Entamoeba dispar (strain ATCC PRA-260 / SAW760) TaxID=370354 RepID=B0EP14_ENTDS|nr:uncharacterized protein EDI_308850 [Entamoeba dispar SAW760]EDR23753.1 hypothetical protein, conserved [Entamoeba dispar SAW760]|eukprot:EDR23753.1 hypothetical protein, conserved [Entamoeba dispar SAW760]
MYKMLGLDGSHSSVMMQISILEQIVTKYPKFFDEITLVSGTQLSSIVVLMISIGYDLTTIKMIMRLILEMYPSRTGMIGGITGVMYDNCYLHVILEEVFGKMKVKDINYLIAVDALQADSFVKNPEDEERTHHAILMTNFKEKYENITCVDLCMRSEAVPGYFEEYQGYLSGMLIENNPVVLCIPYLIGQMGIELDNIICLNISDGDFEPRCYDMEKYGSSGFIKWGSELVNIFQLSRREFSEKTGKYYLGDNFCRIDIEVPKDIEFNDRVKLEEYGRSVEITEYFEWIEKKWITN